MILRLAGEKHEILNLKKNPLAASVMQCRRQTAIPKSCNRRGKDTPYLILFRTSTVNIISLSNYIDTGKLRLQ